MADKKTKTLAEITEELYGPKAQSLQEIEESNDTGIFAEEENGLVELESLCMNCHKDGTTRLLLLRIPYFRDVILESFECPHCHFKNNSVKSAGQIQEKGAKYTLQVEKNSDLERQVVKSDLGIFRLETLGIEMPRGEGQLTNVEGLLSKILTSLEQDQPSRKKENPALHEALDNIIQRLIRFMNGVAYPFVITLDDPTGNSWIAPATDDKGSKYRRFDYPRTHAQNEALGISADAEAQKNEAPNMHQAFGDPEDLDIIDGQVYTLPSECPGCTKACVVNMQKIKVPNFKEVFVWSTVCEHCGYRSNEVKTGGEVPEKGKRIIVQIENITDLSRDILKSDTCAMASEELELSVQPGTLGGRFTTVEGLLTEIRDQLHGQIFNFEIQVEGLRGGDSMESDEKEKWKRFFDRLDSAIRGELKFTMTLEDPLANSYVQNLFEPEVDPQLTIEEYTRTDEEEEDLGLNDMKTEGYEAGETEEKEEAATETTAA